eukprot:8018405-Ditylum_brightwellii.AAC.1
MDTAMLHFVELMPWATGSKTWTLAQKQYAMIAGGVVTHGQDSRGRTMHHSRPNLKLISRNVLHHVMMPMNASL